VQAAFLYRGAVACAASSRCSWASPKAGRIVRSGPSITWVALVNEVIEPVPVLVDGDDRVTGERDRLLDGSLAGHGVGGANP
jgi:hypothetical protein